MVTMWIMFPWLELLADEYCAQEHVKNAMFVHLFVGYFLAGDYDLCRELLFIWQWWY